MSALIIAHVKTCVSYSVGISNITVGFRAAVSGMHEHLLKVQVSKLRFVLWKLVIAA
jgi:hypothetical protein